MLFNKSVFTALVLILNPVQLFAAAENTTDAWKFSLGVGTFSTPAYLGSDQHRQLLVPVFSAKYGDKFFASVVDGVGYNLIKSEGWRAGILARYNPGRREDGDGPFYIDNHSSNDLLGLGDIKSSTEMGGFIEFSANQFLSKVELRKSVDARQGMVGEAEIKYTGPTRVLEHNAFFSIGPKITFADSDYINTYFAINQQQSLASGLDEFEYMAQDNVFSSSLNTSILTYGLHSSLIVVINRSLSVIGIAGIDRITHDVAEAPLIDTRGSRNQSILGIFLNYAF